jgi:hypothetical protein
MMAGHRFGTRAWVLSFSFPCEMMRKTFFTDLFLITLWTNKYQLLSDHVSSPSIALHFSDMKLY